MDCIDEAGRSGRIEFAEFAATAAGSRFIQHRRE
jgi:hypothetical protein